jgi:hypothetical protein
VFSDITPYSPLKVNRRFGGTYSLHLRGRMISRARNNPERWQAELSTMEIYSSCYSETSVGFQPSTLRYISEDYRCENLKSYIVSIFIIRRVDTESNKTTVRNVIFFTTLIYTTCFGPSWRPSSGVTTIIYKGCHCFQWIRLSLG